ncbi:MAG TPA: ACP S-malonyltransferase [bacterium]|nr:ACP S-malonyltransferase [bacterium]HPP86299.1 ACP S-malonyltransferase [bacterium]
MNNIAVVFPGQGAQSKGMGKDLYDKFEIVRDLFEKSKKNSIYPNKDYAGLCFDASEEELQLTINTQPAIYLVSVAIYELLKQKGVKPTIAAGHSLGEYGALYAANVISFEDGLRLLEKRAVFMDECARQTNGAMYAVMGLTEERIKELCNAIDGIVGIAGLNSPGQVVISGELAAVNKFIETAKSAGAGKCIELKVSGAWHSKLMKKAQDNLANELSKINFNHPIFPIISNYTATAETDPEKIKSALIKQLCEPVRWIESVELMINNFLISTIIESGPGKVLTGLIKRINKDITLINVNNLETLENFNI